ncbi:MAG: UvrD-helicase domain-containing protein, partial [Bacteroidota bacterium]
RVEEIDFLCEKLGYHKKEQYDWRRELRTISEIARANDFEREALEKSLALSIESIAAFFPESDGRSAESWNTDLDQRLIDTITAIENGPDQTKTTLTALRQIKKMRTDLRQRKYLPWYEWARLGKLKVGAKSKDAVADLIDFARSVESNAAMHQDIFRFMELLFHTTIEALEEYDSYKKKRGLIDYTDMEVLVNKLLDHEAVAAVLKKELQLLMVDEFQDTSPIQLQIFLKLAQITPIAVWVGDPKQSIYGFRGAEPRLMKAIIDQQGGVSPEDIQSYSWRSRSDIVYATNAIFTKAFADLPVEQVALEPKRKASGGIDPAEPANMGPAIQQWHFEVDDEEKRLPGRPWMENAIAHAIRQVLEKELPILPKDSSEHRALRPGDIAVLCRSNFDCQEMANALHRVGLKAAISRAGLLQTAEVKLVLATLKLLLDPNDSLSVAEIILLTGQQELEHLVDDRLDYLQGLGDTPLYTDDWAADQPFVREIHKLRPNVGELSSAEILETLLADLDLRRTIVAWGNGQQRLANIAVLNHLATQYEDACNRLHTAASLGGFLLWLGELEAKGTDWQGMSEGADTVRIITYHRSKGLEYPLVICHSLENKLRANIWGISLIPESEKLDLKNVLDQRWIRYWVNPYADQDRKTPLHNRLIESEAYQEMVRDAQAEEARLLYVGITRARDYLVFPTRKRPTQWLNRVWNEGNDDLPTLDHQANDTPWVWASDTDTQRILPKTSEIFLFGRQFETLAMPQEEAFFLETRAGKKIQTNFRIDLRDESLGFDPKGSINEIVTYPTPPWNTLEVDVYQLGKALKALITALHPDDDLSANDRHYLAVGLLERYDLIDQVEPEWLVQHAETYYETLVKHAGPPGFWNKKMPLQVPYEGQLFETVLDLYWETEDGIFAVQNSGTTIEAKNAEQKARELADWFYLSKEAIPRKEQGKPLHLFIHLSLLGSIWKISFFDEAPASGQLAIGF